MPLTRTRTARLARRGGRPGSAEAAVCAGSKGRAVPLRDLQPASALPERGRFHPERAQVDVTLGSVVDLVVDGVLDQGEDRARPLAEGDVLLHQAGGGDLGPQLVELRGVLVPELEEAGLVARQLGDAVLAPLARGGAPGGR